MKYRLMDHTADFRIQVFGSDLLELFANAAYGMFDLITDIQKVEGVNSSIIHITGDDWPDLMINWLRELLYIWTGKESLVKQASIQSLSEYKLTATVFYDLYNPDIHQLKNEVKAVTYHQIQVNSVPSGWESTIIFDV